MDSYLRFLINIPDVVYEVFQDEAVIINLGSGSYYSMEKVGAEIWQLLEGGAAIVKIVEDMTQRYDSDPVIIENTINQLIIDLQQENFITPIKENEPEHTKGPNIRVDTSQPETRLSFNAPLLHKYTDMQELLLLDPIHGVDETGWPRAKPDFSKDSG